MIYWEFESNALFFRRFASIDIAMNSFKKYVAKAIKPIFKVIYPKYYKKLGLPSLYTSKTSVIYWELGLNARFFRLFANIDIAISSFKKYVAKAIKPIIKVNYPKYHKYQICTWLLLRPEIKLTSHKKKLPYVVTCKLN